MTKLALVLLKVKDTDRIVMQRRSLDTKNAPGQLGFFGGHIEEGEDATAAIKREIEEETSLNVTDIPLRFIHTRQYQNHDDVTKPFDISLFESDIEDDNFEVYECQGSETYSIGELLKRDDLAVTARSILKTM